MRVGQVRAIFTLPEKVRQVLFLPGVEVPGHLAYIDWLSPFMDGPDAQYHMYRVRMLSGEAKIASVVSLSRIERSVHLFPKWGGPAPRDWTNENVLEHCTVFYVNQYKDPHSYYNLY